MRISRKITFSSEERAMSKSGVLIGACRSLGPRIGEQSETNAIPEERESNENGFHMHEVSSTFTRLKHLLALTSLSTSSKVLVSLGKLSVKESAIEAV
jgi:hypothetical protein